MNKLIINGAIYEPYDYATEKEFERVIVENSASVFGRKCIYFDIKKKLGTSNKGAAIPDGYLLDLTFHTSPRLHFVEIELESHDIYGHIGEQLLRFSISFDDSKYKLKNFLLDDIKKDPKKRQLIDEYLKEAKYDNETALLDAVIYDMSLSTIVIIDHATDQLARVLSKLTDKTDIIEFESYCYKDKIVHRYTPYLDDVIESEDHASIDADELDTIVVPARDDGFNEEFIANNRWYSIRISSSMLDKIKYIAAYRVSPISAITHIAEVERIEKYEDSGKYILYFKENPKQIEHIPLGSTAKGIAPQAPRYTNYAKLLESNSVKELFSQQ